MSKCEAAAHDPKAIESRALYLDFLLLACLAALQIIVLFLTSLKVHSPLQGFQSPLQKTNKAIY